MRSILDVVKVYHYEGIDSVQGSMITLKRVEEIWPSGYMPSHENGDDVEVVLEGIQTVIFCTTTVQTSICLIPVSTPNVD